MSTFKVNVKWGKELFKDVDLDTNEPPIIFKAQLFALTNVQPERQKIMFKGQTLNDDTWSNFSGNLKNGVMFMMMGSVDTLPKAPTIETKFIEDLDDSQLAIALDLPVGLQNLGNTCYLNSVVQCLKVVPELCNSLSTYKLQRSSLNDDMSNNLVLALANTYEYMDKHRMSYSPLLLVQLIRTIFPQFSTTSEHGGYQQQDASECWTELLRVLQQKLPSTNKTKKYRNFIDEYFSGEFKSTLKCIESENEIESEQTETFLQLSCFISQDVKYLQTGLKLRLEEDLIKHSPTLNRDANYRKISRICRLPAYLCVQYVRFFYKEKDKVNAKILKDVKFQLNLDVFELCTPELQKNLLPMREKFRIIDERKADEIRILKKQLNDPLNIDSKSIASTTQTPNTSTDTQYSYAPYSFEDDNGSNNSGLYELIAVLTHKGRSSNSGHYVGWAKNLKTSQWLMFDDDNVNQVTEEDILKLSGGGDHHLAYILLYAPRKLDLNYYNETIKLRETKNETIDS